MSVRGFKARVDPSLACFLACVQWILKIDHRCDTCDTFFYRPQRSWGKVMFLHVSVILFTGSGGWYPSMLCRWYPSMPCRLPGRGVSRPTPRGKLRGLARGVSRPTPRGLSRPTPRGVSRPMPGGGVYPSMHRGRPLRGWLLPRSVRFYWNAFLFQFNLILCAVY